METVLQAKNMTKIYGMGSKQPFTALENIDLEIKTGEFIVVMGPSGSGKSTLVNNISTIDIPTNGSLYILNQEVKQMSENQLGKFRYQYLGFVFQNYNLIDYLTPIENVRLVNKKASEDILLQLGLDKSQINRNVMKLSGGQQQRVAIARALASEAPIILADEPTGNLDSDTAGEIIEILKRLAKERNKCVIVVTHSKEVADSADIILELSGKNLKKVNKMNLEVE